MYKLLFKRKGMILFLLLMILSITCNYHFESVNQPNMADQNSIFEVEIVVSLGAEDKGGIPYFGICLPVGWTVIDSISYTGALNGVLIYSKEQSDTMETIENAPNGYYWWVSIGDSVSLLPDGIVALKPRIKTDDQTGMFFLNYMLGDNDSGLNKRRSDNHPISVGLPKSVTVTNTNDKGEGSLREALANVSHGGEIQFDLSYPATILLESQLVIDRSVTISGPDSGILCISGNNNDRVLFIKENLTVTISNISIGDGYVKGDVGGGIFCAGSNLSLSNVTIADNSAGSGGGIYIDQSDLTLSRVTINENSADSGGGITSMSCNLIITNVLISNNASKAEGGGIACFGGDKMILTNSTIICNTADTGGGIYNDIYRSTIVNSIIWDNKPDNIWNYNRSPKVFYSDIQGGFPGKGNINSDPLFIDSIHYHLNEHSPCIDSGDPDTIFNDWEDPDNVGYALWPAQGTIRNDMGAHGGHGKYKHFVWEVISYINSNSVDFINEKFGWMAGEDLILKTQNGGETWISFPIKWTFDMIDFTSESVGWAIENRHNVYKTEDGGEIWLKKKEFQDDYETTSLHAVDDKVVYIVAIVTGTDYPCGAVIKSLDGGKTWLEVTPDNNRCALESVWALNSNGCFISGRSSLGGSILYTFDGGNSWDEKIYPVYYGIYALQFLNNSTGYFLTENNILCQTIDTCKSWRELTEGVTSYYVLDDNTIFVLTGSEILSSSNEGSTWESTQPGSIEPIKIQFVNNSVGWIVGMYGDIYKTTDGGDSWSDLNPFIIEIMGIEDDNEDINQLPVQFNLSQNYPNPFNPTTTIRYQIPKAIQVELSIYNLVGQKVATLVSAKQQAGQYQVHWDASGLSSGIYFYCLQAGNAYKQMKKMLLVR